MNLRSLFLYRYLSRTPHHITQSTRSHQDEERKRKVEKKVKFLGWVDNKSKRISDLYGKASIFVLPSYFENMSLVLLEALASGCTVLASNVGGNPEVVNKEDLFEVGNIAELRRKIEKNMKRKMKINKLDKRFYLSKIIKEFEEIL